MLLVFDIPPSLSVVSLSHSCEHMHMHKHTYAHANTHTFGTLCPSFLSLFSILLPTDGEFKCGLGTTL